MTSSLVGSEMCIRDRSRMRQQPDEFMTKDPLHLSLDQADALRSSWGHNTCLLYTSDAADDM
eukprot:11324865-Prorocentrum_lima.AAC.1